jgi:hypothetical protein
MNFERDKNPLRTMKIGRTVLDELKDHPICKPMNDPFKDVDDPRDPNLRVWINPHDQTSFNAMWCDEKVLRAWMEGKGPMVKGKNEEEKANYWKYAKALSEDENHIIWSILYHWRWFNELKSDFNQNNHVQGGTTFSYIKNPLKITKTNHKQIILDMYVPFISMIKNDMEFREWQNMRREYDGTFSGIKRTLYCLGIGFLGANNTPEGIMNLQWLPDLIYARGYYLYLEEQKKDLPDFEWLSSQIYKSKPEEY